MPKEYIEREALIEELKRRDFLPVIVKHAIEAVPAADVAPVVHGRWKQSDFISGVHACTVCGAQKNPNFRIGFGAWNYCPNCGAKMDGEERR